MTSDEIDKAGGPAHPGVIPDNFREAWPGMTLRDYFAGQALVGLISISQAPPSEFAKQPDRVAQIAFIIADAMLNRRAEQLNELPF